MRRLVRSGVMFLAMSGLFLSGILASDLFTSEGMRGVTPQFLAPVAIRNVSGPGAPWTLGHGEVRIGDNGRLRVAVEGLVLDPQFVPSERGGGTNPVSSFRAVVSCLSGVDAAGTPTFTNVVTETFPADAQGNAALDTTISLPDPCFGIIVFVTNPTGRWFAVTGF